MTNVSAAVPQHNVVDGPVGPGFQFPDFVNSTSSGSTPALLSRGRIQIWVCAVPTAITQT